jgi:hypothetical protein
MTSTFSNRPSSPRGDTDAIRHAGMIAAGARSIASREIVTVLPSRSVHELYAGAWAVDAAKLRATLDDLRSALALHAPVLVDTSTLLSIDRARLAEVLRALVARLASRAAIDAPAHGSFVPELGSPVRSSELGLLFRDLQAAWKRRLYQALGLTKTWRLRDLLARPSPDLVSIFGRENHENTHSDMLAWLLDPRTAPVIAPHALRKLVAVLGSEAWPAGLEDAISRQCLSVRREYVIGREWDSGGDLARIDIVIIGPAFVLAIENKVWASEHADQTTSYWRWLRSLPGLRGGILLSPSGVCADCPDFRPVSYLDMVAYLLEGPSRAAVSPEEESVLSSYLKTLAGSVLRTELRALAEIGHAE